MIRMENFVTFKHNIIDKTNDAFSSSEGVLKLCKDWVRTESKKCWANSLWLFPVYDLVGKLFNFWADHIIDKNKWCIQ